MTDKSVTKEMLLEAGYEEHEKSRGYVRELGDGKRFHFIPLHLTLPLEEGFHIHVDRLNPQNNNHMSYETKDTKKAMRLELKRIEAVWTKMQEKKLEQKLKKKQVGFWKNIIKKL